MGDMDGRGTMRTLCRKIFSSILVSVVEFVNVV
jgi:hypothetical protein